MGINKITSNKKASAFAVIFVIAFVLAMVYIATVGSTTQRESSRKNTIENTQRSFLGSYGEFFRVYADKTLTFSAQKAMVNYSEKGLGAENGYFMVNSISTFPALNDIIGGLEDETKTYCSEYLSKLANNPDMGKIIFQSVPGFGDIEININEGNLAENYREFDISASGQKATLQSGTNNELREINYDNIAS